MSNELFDQRVNASLNSPNWKAPAAFALGVATSAGASGTPKVLDVRYPSVNCGANERFAGFLADLVGWDGSTTAVAVTVDQLDAAIAATAPFLADGGAHPNARALPLLRDLVLAAPTVPRTRRSLVATFVADLADAPSSTEDAWLRLHLLSNRAVRPHGTSLDGIFGLLNNVVWTNVGPADPETFGADQMELIAHGVHVSVLGVDKFPAMLNYVVPSGVRIADASRVRLGAYLSEGTTVMHEGFVNFNAGTLGVAMVEGRISAGVVVGDNTDLGGSASIMGTLSGGGKEVISIGQRCLLGANSGLGISLGDDCVVEAGLYLTGGTVVELPNGSTCKARELSGHSSMLFRRNSLTGAVQMIAKGDAWSEGLNAALHAND